MREGEQPKSSTELLWNTQSAGAGLTDTGLGFRTATMQRNHATLCTMQASACCVRAISTCTWLNTCAQTCMSYHCLHSSTLGQLYVRTYLSYETNTCSNDAEAWLRSWKSSSAPLLGVPGKDLQHRIRCFRSCFGCQIYRSPPPSEVDRACRGEDPPSDPNGLWSMCRCGMYLDR